jgi:hypothetical protein
MTQYDRNQRAKHNYYSQKIVLMLMKVSQKRSNIVSLTNGGVAQLVRAQDLQTLGGE